MPANELSSIDSPNIAATIAEISAKPSQVAESDYGRLFAVPEGYRLETDQALHQLNSTPHRKAGAVQLRTVESFVQYVNQHRQPQTQIYVVVTPDNAANPLVATAVFNDHGFEAESDEPGWRDFRAVFQPDSSAEWKTWITSNGKRMSQVQFATFIEDNLKCFAGAGTDGGDDFPSGGAMLQMALAFEASQDKRIKSSVRIQSGGIQLEYVDNDDAATVSRMQAFDRFRLGLAPFWRGAAYPLESRLRYRNSGGELQLWYDLVRPDLVVDYAVEELINKIETETSITPIFGTITK
jgi:uncharacterized protein YfdQ (DUF2303 family)